MFFNICMTYIGIVMIHIVVYNYSCICYNMHILKRILRLLDGKYKVIKGTKCYRGNL